MQEASKRVPGGGRPRARLCLAGVAALLLLGGTAGAQQDLGHKLPGALGLGAGKQAEPGVYLAYRFAFWAADSAVDREGRPLPVRGLAIDAFSHAVGLEVTFKLAEGGPYVGAAFGAPVSQVSLNSDDPRVSVDRFGFGDLFLSPLKLGFRRSHLDLVTGYAFYAPTGHFEPVGGAGVGRGFWTHQFSLGSALYFDEGRRSSLSVLASYDLNLGKRGLDLQRGDTILVQGGLGASVLLWLEVGMAGYALFQVRDDAGADLPPLLRGARDRVFGLGPELNVTVPRLRSQIGLRYEHDFAARSRPVGELVLVSLTVLLWRPTKRGP